MALSGCGGPAFTYVADSAASTYYEVPSQWHQISQQNLNSVLQADGSPTSMWSTAYDADAAPSGNNFLDPTISKPFAFAEVIPLSSTATAELSYNMLRDFFLPVTSATRQEAAASGYPLTDFKSLRDQTITAKQGVHGVRETFQYTFPGGVADTFDEDVLTNADQTTAYLLVVHCTNTCYSQNENSINAVLSSFTVGSPT
ncbi:MAG TPA: hypothetical protein VIZ43_02180 [Trebonia sp.]